LTPKRKGWTASLTKSERAETNGQRKEEREKKGKGKEGSSTLAHDRDSFFALQKSVDSPQLEIDKARRSS